MQPRNRTPERLTLYLAALASVFYLGGGIALIASSQSFGFLPSPGPIRYGLAILLIGYGTVRGIRAYQRYRDED